MVNAVRASAQKQATKHSIDSILGAPARGGHLQEHALSGQTGQLPEGTDPGPAVAVDAYVANTAGAVQLRAMESGSVSGPRMFVSPLVPFTISSNGNNLCSP